MPAPPSSAHSPAAGGPGARANRGGGSRAAPASSTGSSWRRWGLGRSVRVAADHLGAEAGHLLALGRELQQHEADSGPLIGAEALDDLAGGADEPAAQAPVGDAVLLHRDPRLKL